MMLFVLATSSPSREQLIKHTGCLPDLIISPDIDETPQKNELPHHIALRLAQQKAEKVYSELSPSRNKEQNLIVLAADTVCCVGRLSLPKATTEEEASFCLDKISGRRHKIHTGVCFIGINKSGQLQKIVKIATTTIKLKNLSSADKLRYIASGEWKNTAGGYRIEGQMGCFIQTTAGAAVSNSGGLPLNVVYPLLQHFGVTEKNKNG